MMIDAVRDMLLTNRVLSSLEVEKERMEDDEVIKPELIRTLCHLAKDGMFYLMSSTALKFRRYSKIENSIESELDGFIKQLELLEGASCIIIHILSIIYIA